MNSRAQENLNMPLLKAAALYGSSSDDVNELKKDDAQRILVLISTHLTKVNAALRAIEKDFSTDGAKKIKGYFGVGFLADSYDKCINNCLSKSSITKCIKELETVTYDHQYFINGCENLKKSFADLFVLAMDFPKKLAVRKEEVGGKNGEYNIALLPQTQMNIDDVKNKITTICNTVGITAPAPK